ncbi:hypothetical protein A1395_28675 [Pseudomonas protegens]|uniref:hypothetical protein n=1 Tax=Pseudomonas protegens TaxID=380021 RepID=UPI000C9B6966|nr:hypothetical protein [Pseudomonas protegens]PNG29064.1 hypothetical protein A1395_28675 [Pseudomonas protegens]
MAIETDVLVELLKVDALHDETDIVKGIAQRAVDYGFETLSARQQGVINHLLSKECGGVTDPGGYHNNCQAVLTDQDLVNATTNSGYFGDWLCEDCRNESDGYDRERERFMAE